MAQAVATNKEMSTSEVSTNAAFLAMMQRLRRLCSFITNVPELAIAVESVHPSAIIGITVLSINHNYLVDTYKLQEDTTYLVRDAMITMRMFLESSEVPKLFPNGRRDQQTIFTQFGITIEDPRSWWSEETDDSSQILTTAPTRPATVKCHWYHTIESDRGPDAFNVVPLALELLGECSMRFKAWRDRTKRRAKAWMWSRGKPKVKRTRFDID